jgi:MGT family glycosyltransferase
MIYFVRFLIVHLYTSSGEKMTKAIFFGIPGHGHINPSLPLVTELCRREHHIIYFATPQYRSRIEATGAEFRAYTMIPDNYFDAYGLHGGQAQKVSRQLIATTKQVLPELLAMARTEAPDYILYDGMCPWGYFVAQVMKCPAVVSLALLAPVSPPLQALLKPKLLSLALPMLLRDLDQGVAANRHVKRLAKQYCVAPLSPVSILNAPGDLGISYTSSYFQPYANTAPPSVRFVGWTLADGGDPSGYAIDTVRARRLVYVSLGTVNNKGRAFFETCIEAFADKDLFAIISTGNGIDPQSFGKLPENIAIYGWVPQAAVLKQAALFITHGGLNSVHDGLYCGVPLLVVPQQEEQGFNGLRVVELGAGLMLEKKNQSAAALGALAMQVLTEPRYKAGAGQVGETLRNAGGAARGADEIEQLLKIRQMDISF